MAKKHPEPFLIYKFTFQKAKVLQKVIRMAIMGIQIAANKREDFGWREKPCHDGEVPG